MDIHALDFIDRDRLRRDAEAVRTRLRAWKEPVPLWTLAELAVHEALLAQLAEATQRLHARAADGGEPAAPLARWADAPPEQRGLAELAARVVNGEVRVDVQEGLASTHAQRLCRLRRRLRRARRARRAADERLAALERRVDDVERGTRGARKRRAP